MARVPALMALATLTGWCAAQPCDDLPLARGSGNCGVAALVSMAHLLGRAMVPEQASAIRTGLAGDVVTMLQIKRTADAAGLPLRGVRASLDALCREVLGPKIIHLARPAHFVVLVRGDGEWAQVMDAGRLALIPRAELEGRYAGEALILDVRDLDSAPRVGIEAFAYTFRVAGVGQKVEHRFRVANAGHAPLALQGLDPKG